MTPPTDLPSGEVDPDFGYPPDFDVQAFIEDFGFSSFTIAALEERMRHYLAVVRAAHTIGPFIDPTKYRDALQRNGNMDDLAELVRLALPLAEKTREARERFGGRPSS